MKTKIIKGFIVAVVCLVLLKVMLPASMDVPLLQAYPRAVQLYDCHGTLLQMSTGTAGWDCRPVAIEQCSPWLAKELIAAEDKRFYRHGGIDIRAVLRAVLVNLWQGRIKSGASTITTQVVKMSHPASRTWRTKLREAWQAIQVEKELDKPAILERYLNHVSLGGIRVGVESAALYYFGKHAKDLSLAEAAVLMGLPQAPSRLRPDRHIERTHMRRHYVLSQMRKCGMISEELYARTIAEPVVIQSGDSAFNAPHFCDYVQQQAQPHGAVHTTLDLDLQKTVEDVLKRYQTRHEEMDIHGAAIVVIDVASSAVRAMVGSPDFFDAVHEGQYNCAVAPRSPGSTLKPFVYAMAFEQGLCMPGTLIRDEPMAYRQFVPQNYNQTFQGHLTIRQALVESLNIPAVKLGEKVGVRAMLQRLKSLGIRSLTQDAGHYGVGLVLGGCEVSLIELCNAYACLARSGLFRPLSVIKETPAIAPMRIFSAASAYMVSDILKDTSRWEQLAMSSRRVPFPPMALKTGTSSGHRDAWAVAYNPAYVVGVWLGNPDGQHSDGLVGAEVAAPLARDLFRQLYPSGAGPWFSCPENVSLHRYCVGSGMPVGPDCSGSYTDLGMESTACCRCLLRQAECDSEPVQMLSPADGAVYKRVSGVSGLSQTLTLKVSAPGSEKVYWFINDQFYRVATPSRPVFWPIQKGIWRITCSAAGASVSCRITVE